jgi:hypothetical protein
VSQEGATPSAHEAGCIDVGVAHGIEVGGRGLLESPTSLHVCECGKVSIQGVVALWGRLQGYSHRSGIIKIDLCFVPLFEDCLLYVKALCLFHLLVQTYFDHVQYF